MAHQAQTAPLHSTADSCTFARTKTTVVVNLISHIASNCAGIVYTAGTRWILRQPVCTYIDTHTVFSHTVHQYGHYVSQAHYNYSLVFPFLEL